MNSLKLRFPIKQMPVLSFFSAIGSPSVMAIFRISGLSTLARGKSVDISVFCVAV